MKIFGYEITIRKTEQKKREPFNYFVKLRNTTSELSPGCKPQYFASTREKAKRRFFEVHKALIEKAMICGDHKTIYAKELVKLARVEIHYSNKSASCDIFASIICQFKKWSKIANFVA